MADLRNKPIDKQENVGENGSTAGWEAFLTQGGKAQLLEYGADRDIFQQGTPAESVFYLRRGKVKLSVASQQGKEAIIAVLNSGDLIGEGCLSGQRFRMETTTAVTECSLMRIDRRAMTRLLHEQHGISELFSTYLLSRNIRYAADLTDQLFNSSQKRLARILLLLSQIERDSKAAAIPSAFNQEHLAEMVGTTRSRVSHFLNEFRKQGLISYKKCGELTIHSGLLSVVHEEDFDRQ